ncbi:MAG: sulfite exporter TauE/SafE family protein [Pseudomonadota bacterium]
MFDVYSPAEVAVIFAAYLFAATAKGVTGLGFSTTCLAIVALTVGLKNALPLLIIPSISTNLMVMAGAGHFTETVRRFWPMYLATIPGVIAGLWLLGSVDGIAAGIALGVVLIGYCTFAYANPNLRLPARLERPLQPVSGLLTGIVNGTTGSQVMPSMPFLMALHMEKNRFVQAINISFTLSSLIMVIGLNRMGLFTTEGVVLSIIGTVFAVAGIRLGERVRDRLNADQFRLAVLAMLSVMGLVLIARGI